MFDVIPRRMRQNRSGLAVCSLLVIYPRFLFRGPDGDGLPNKEKVRIRQLCAEGKSEQNGAAGVGSRLLPCAGTCTFYGTASTNQMVVGL